jgi:hypothetical protein
MRYQSQIQRITPQERSTTVGLGVATTKRMVALQVSGRHRQAICTTGRSCNLSNPQCLCVAVTVALLTTMLLLMALLMALLLALLLVLLMTMLLLALLPQRVLLEVLLKVQLILSVNCS